MFLGLIDLKNRSMLMVGLAAIAQYFQGTSALPKTEKGKELSVMEKWPNRWLTWSSIHFIDPLAASHRPWACIG